MAGLLPDGRQIVLRACEEATNYKNFYGDMIPGHVLGERLASYVHLFNLYWSMRPYGVATLLAVHDHNLGPQLYLIEPSGVAMVGPAAGAHWALLCLTFWRAVLWVHTSHVL